MFEELSLKGLMLVTPKRHIDDRGFFSETYSALTWKNSGYNYHFVQDNQSATRDKGTIRGLHFQIEPYAQDKLVRVLQGKILDVAVDLRRSSPTYGQYIAVELSRENWRQLFIPKGFAHGFVTLEPATEIAYKVTNYYSRIHDFGVAWNDPDLNINWGFPPNDIFLSEKDRNLPFLRDIGFIFP